MKLDEQTKREFEERSFSALSVEPLNETSMAVPATF